MPALLTTMSMPPKRVGDGSRSPPSTDARSVTSATEADEPLGQVVGVEVEHGDAGAAGGEGGCRRQADPGGAAGDDGDEAVELAGAHACTSV